MRVLLISTNQLKPDHVSNWIPVYPLGMAYLTAALRCKGYEVNQLDLCFVPDIEQEIRSTIQHFQPDVIGISFRNIEMMSYFHNTSFLDDLQRTVNICRNSSDAHLIVGGSGFSIMPERILETTNVDFGIVGEAEWSLPLFLDVVHNGSDYHDIPGLMWLEQGQVKSSNAHKPHKIMDFVMPDRSPLDLERYLQAGGTVNIQTKRGCPFRCIYCTYPLIEGRHIRCRPAAHVAHEVKLLHQRYNFTSLYVVDSQFNFPIDHAQKVCDELLVMKDDMKIRWSCMLNPGFITEDLIVKLRLSRCHYVDLGIETAAISMLENLGKNFSQTDITKSIKLLRKYKLPSNTWILLGGPGETEETIRETLDYLETHHVERVLFSVGIRVCPGTTLEQIMYAEQKLDRSTDFLQPIFYLSLASQKIVELVQPYCDSHPEWHISGLF